MDINVISVDLDGAELRKEKRKNPMHTRCDGTADEGNIKEASERATKGKTWVLPVQRWFP
jgi:hypothetical protein